MEGNSNVSRLYTLYVTNAHVTTSIKSYIKPLCDGHIYSAKNKYAARSSYHYPWMLVPVTVPSCGIGGSTSISATYEDDGHTVSAINQSIEKHSKTFNIGFTISDVGEEPRQIKCLLNYWEPRGKRFVFTCAPSVVKVAFQPKPNGPTKGVQLVY